MNSQNISNQWNLVANDWKNWEGEATANTAPPTPGVYIFRAKQSATLNRVVGVSDIVYIGSTSGRSLRERLLDHSKQRSDADSGRRIFRLQQKYSLEVAWKSFESPEEKEAELLAFYEIDHYELPPCNRTRGKVPWEVLFWSPKALEEAIKKLGRT